MGSSNCLNNQNQGVEAFLVVGRGSGWNGCGMAALQEMFDFTMAIRNQQ